MVDADKAGALILPRQACRHRNMDVFGDVMNILLNQSCHSREKRLLLVAIRDESLCENNRFIASMGISVRRFSNS